MVAPRRVSTWLAFALAVIAGCGGARLEGSIYRDGALVYRIGDLGPGWSRLSLGSHNDLAWRSADIGAIVQVNATCAGGADVPLTALTNHLLIGFTAREIADQRVVPMDGREALRTHVRARLDGVPRELLFFVMKKDGCVYDFALIAPAGAPFERGRAPFERFVAGFSTEVR